MKKKVKFFSLTLEWERHWRRPEFGVDPVTWSGPNQSPKSGGCCAPNNRPAGPTNSPNVVPVSPEILRRTLTMNRNRLRHRQTLDWNPILTNPQHPIRPPLLLLLPPHPFDWQRRCAGNNANNADGGCNLRPRKCRYWKCVAGVFSYCGSGCVRVSSASFQTCHPNNSNSVDYYVYRNGKVSLAYQVFLLFVFCSANISQSLQLSSFLFFLTLFRRMTSMRGVPENNGEMLLLLQTNELVKQHKKHKNEKRNSSKVHVFPACVSIRDRERERDRTQAKHVYYTHLLLLLREHFWRNSLIPWYVINYSHQVKVKGAKKTPHERRRIKKKSGTVSLFFRSSSEISKRCLFLPEAQVIPLVAVGRAEISDGKIHFGQL